MVKVKVQQGWLSGEQLEASTGDGQYYSFKGIPYAEPPVGKLRFKAPQPPLPWDGVRKATEHGPKCPQVDIFTQQVITGSEDCLFLNVYSPNLKPSSPLPVMVFIHGGGFKSGSGDIDHYGPDFLITHGVVVVTINYRLEAFGFLCLDTENVPGNAGMKDQVEALRWVKTNINNFGGDPDNVTIFGESAGGSSTALHILSPLSKGLFKRAIPMSGVPLCDWSIPFVPQMRPYMLAKDLGFETNDPNKLLDFLQKLPAEKLINVNPIVFSFEKYNNNLLKMYHFTPVVEKDFGQNHFLSEDPLEILKKGNINDVDVLIGHTSSEALVGIPWFEASYLNDYNRYPELVVPRKILNKSDPKQLLEISRRIHEYYFKGKPVSVDTMNDFITYCNDVTFVYDVNSFISKLSKYGQGHRYVYKFSSVSNRNVYGNLGLKYGIRGAAHLDDLMYLFDAKIHNLTIERDTKEYQLVQLACTVFTNFAKYGNPTPDPSLGATWPEFNAASRAYVDIGDALTLGSNSDAEIIKFWRSIYASAGLEY